MKLSVFRTFRRRHAAALDGPRLSSAATRELERECSDMLDQLRPQAPFDKNAYLSHLGYIAGGPIYTGILPEGWDELVASVHGGYLSAFTCSQFDGWTIYINRRMPTPEPLLFGHESAHVIFDLPRGTGSPPTSDRLQLPRPDSGAAEQLLANSLPRGGGFTSPRESRAERFGTLLKARLEGLGGQADAHDGSLSSLFRAGDV